MMCFVAFSFAMTSCQKAEDLIIGKWKCTKVVTDGQTDNEPIGSIWEFKSDNTFSMSLEGLNVPGTYTIADDVLTLVMFGETTTMNIDKITKSKMVLSDPENKDNIAEFEKQ